MGASKSRLSDDPGSARTPVELWARHDGLTNSQYWREYISRLTAGRDMHTMVTAASETGVGKTTLAFALARIGDVNGWTAEKGTLDPGEYAFLYDKQNLCDEHEGRGHLPREEFRACDDCTYYLGPGSWLIGDEWEQAVDARNAMTKENKEASHAAATKRYRQIFAVYTLPSKSWMDSRFASDTADYWIQVQETDLGKPKGEAYVYRLRNNEHYETSYTTRTETIEWPVLDDHPEYRKLKEKKRERAEGTQRRTYIHRDEFEEAKKNFWNKATKKTRYHLVKAMCKYGIQQSVVSDILNNAEHVEGLSQGHISKLVNSESFEEFYNTDR